MKIWETLERDPRQQHLANGGQARILSRDDEHAEVQLRAELETFVCDGQYRDAMERILRSYLERLGQPRQNAAWVSGFYGSGKSHLLKMLGHLWENTPFSDGATPRSLVSGLSKEIQDHLRELDGAAQRSGSRLIAACGAMPSGVSDRVRQSVLETVFGSLGLPKLYQQAKLCLWLRGEGVLAQVRQHVTDAGRDWNRELSNIHVSSHLANAILAYQPNFAGNTKEALDVLRKTYPSPTTDCTTEQFLTDLKSVLAPDGGEIPHTILVLDEAQQYIGESSDRATLFTEMVEAVQTQMGSRVLLVASGQAALSDTPVLRKLLDRFVIRIALSDQDVETVTRKVLLQKRPGAGDDVRSTLDRHAGEVSRHLQGSRISERGEADRKTIVVDYPLLPTRRRFWEQVFKKVDRSGTHGQLRSQLRIIYDALRDVADEPLGHVIPADAIYEAIRAELQSGGVLSNEIDTRIAKLEDGTEEGLLRRRICTLVFLIQEMNSGIARGSDADLGVRATPAMIADLLVEDVSADSGPLRSRVEAALIALADESKLLRVGDEYQLQTEAGAEWDRAFRDRQSALRQEVGTIAQRREQLLHGEVGQAVAGIRLRHGELKIPRTLSVHTGAEAPKEPAGIPVWIRDEWSTSSKDVLSAARQAGGDDPVIHVFIPRRSNDELGSRIAEVLAASRVLEEKAPPTEAPPEVRTAYESMRSRKERAEHLLQSLVREIAEAAAVYKGGGTEQYGLNLQEKIRAAAEASLTRLYPRFDEADSVKWQLAVERAKQGNEQPLAPLGHTGPTEDHPVCREVIASVGSGATGSTVRKRLTSPPFGWGQDAIDAALIALANAGILRVTQNGQKLKGRLDQNAIAKAEFKSESVHLTTPQKLSNRSLFQALDLPSQAGDDENVARQAIALIRKLAEEAGGEPPLPAPEQPEVLDDLQGRSGNDLLASLATNAARLRQLHDTLVQRRDLARKRLDEWRTLEQLLAHVEHPIDAGDAPQRAETIRTKRLLLEPDDHVQPLVKKVAAALRAAVTDLHDRHLRAHAAAMEELAADAAWSQLSDLQRQGILKQVHLAEPSKPGIGTDEALVRELNHTRLPARENAIAALSGQVQRARELAAKELEPKSQFIKLPGATLKTEQDVDRWIGEQRDRLLAALKTGPVVLS